MKYLKLTAVIIVVAIVLIVAWRLGFFAAFYESKAKPVKPETVIEPNKPSEVNQPADVNKPGQPKKARKKRKMDVNAPVEPNKVADANDQMVAINLNDVEMRSIIEKIAKWTGKVVIPDDKIMKEKITIYAPDKLPKTQALSLIYSALHRKGFVAEYSENVIYLKPIKEAILGSVPIVPADQPLAGIENKSKIVQKFFKLKHYSPAKMTGVIQPLVGEYGYVGADENTGSLIVIDTVENLIRIENIIAQFDVPGYEQTVEEIFEIQNGDPAEIVQMLRILLGDETAVSGAPPTSAAPAMQGPRGRRGQQPGGSTPAVKSVIVRPGKTRIVLIPDQKLKRIIAKASAEDMEKIKKWITILDKKETLTSESETIAVRYADVEEVAQRLNEALQRRPGTELSTNVLIQPLKQARQIIVFGRAEMREIVKKLVEEIDMPPGDFEQKTFQLQHADPEEIKQYIDELYGTETTNIRYFFGSMRREPMSPDTVKAVAYPMMKQITVFASPQNMRKIEKQIEEWDIPVEVGKLKPRIIELRNSDPVRMAELLTTLFSEAEADQFSIWDYFWGDGSREQRKKIVGPLYGRLTFEAVPDTKKIIIISNIPEAYDLVEELIHDIDSREIAEVPMVVTLNYADAEDLCEQLNATLNEPGTTATIRRSKRGLSQYEVSSETGQTTSKAGEEETTVSENTIKPWWSEATARMRVGEEMPISNIIGRIRFVPVHRSKAVLVLSPREYQQSIREMIQMLDKPGKQVMIKAIIIEVNHDSMTSLGIKLSSNPLAFNVGENALSALTQLRYAERYIPEAEAFKIDTGTSITALVDFLIQNTGAKVLNQPTLWTKDNEEADFFKGGLVPFVVSTQTSSEGTAQRDSVEYRPVGVTLRVRPNITPEKNVDMTINLVISQLEAGLVAGKVATSQLNTTTRMIVEDGQAVMLGGILFQTDSRIKQKIPLLGDIPLIGGIFGHDETRLTNDELIVFITPYVIDERIKAQTQEQLENAQQKVQNALKKLNASIDANLPAN